MRKHSRVLISCAVSSVLASAASLAQTATSSTADPGDRSIDHIIVTAQKREQNLQEVPIVVTAVSGELLRDTGVRDIKELTILTPGLVVTSTSNETVTTARIRGIGTVGDNPGLESSVGVVIDGVYRPRNGVSFGDLGEVERIEVLKGPQGTLFGKNTSAGVINVVTLGPQEEFGADLDFTVGNYGTREAAGSITGPIWGERLTGRLFAARRDRDGLYDVNTGAGPRTDVEDADRNFYTVRGQLQFEPMDALTLRLIGDYTERNEVCCAATQVVIGQTAPIVDAVAPDAGLRNPADPFERRAFSNRPTDQHIEDRGVSLQADWDIGQNMSVTSITGWRDWETVNGQDPDFTTADLLVRRPNGLFGNVFEQFSQELRIAGETEQLSWLFGAFYAREDLDAGQELLAGNAFEPYSSLLFSRGQSPLLLAALANRLPGTSYSPGAGQFDFFEQQSDSWALITNNSWRITEALEATLGVRYTSESKDLESHYRNTGGAGVGCSALRNRFAQVQGFFSNALAQAGTPPQLLPAALEQTLGQFYGANCAPFFEPVFDNIDSRQSIDESEWSGTAKLAYRFTPDVMAYASYARGYKAGGFNLDRERIGSPASNAIQPDLDTRFPAETVDSYELGTKTSWAGRRLLVNATVFYQEYQDFQLNTFTGINFIVTPIPEVTSQGVDLDVIWLANERLSLQSGFTYAETEYGDFVPGPGVSPLLPGNQVSFAPEWSGSVALTYEHPLSSSLEARGNISAKYLSSYNTGSDLNPLKEQDAYTLVNARVGVGGIGDTWALELWAQNLTDEEYYQVVFDATLQTGTLNAFLGAPRTYGVTLRMSF